jgi:hypothetical protein
VKFLDTNNVSLEISVNVVTRTLPITHANRFEAMRKILALFLSLFASAAFATVTPLPGAADQHAMAGHPFPNPIGVQVTDDAGRPVPGVAVTFISNSIYAGGFELNGGFYRLTVQTDAEGAARVGADARADSGERHVVSADAGVHGYAVMYFTTDPIAAGPNRVTALSSTEQTVPAGSALPETMRVRVTSSDGTPVRGGLVSFFPDPKEVVGSFGAASRVTVATDIYGIAEAPPFMTSLATGRGVVVAWHVGTVGVISEARFFFTNTAPTTPPKNYQDMWWGGPEQSGWGVSVTQHDSKIFAVVFAYDANGAPTWHVIPQPSFAGGFGRSLQGPSYQPRGTPYYAYDASRLEVGQRYGFSQIEFIGGKEARLFMSGAHFGGDSNQGLAGQGLVRQVFTVNPDIPLRGVGDMWWGGPSQNGWGIAIHEQPGALFSVWLTYGDDGNPTWFVMPGGAWTGANEYSGQIYRTRSSAFLETPYDATKLQLIPVGTYRLRFDGNNATFEYAVEGRSSTLPLTRQPF